jgi:hypothetical protein
MRLAWQGSGKGSVEGKKNGLRLMNVTRLFFPQEYMVGVVGFELTTPCTPCKCATRLRYTPSLEF